MERGGGGERRKGMERGRKRREEKRQDYIPTTRAEEIKPKTVKKTWLSFGSGRITDSSGKKKKKKKKK